MPLFLTLLLFFAQADSKPVYNREEYLSNLKREFFRGDFWDMLTYPNSGKGYFSSKAEARKLVTIVPIPVVEPTASKAGLSFKQDRMAAFVLKKGKLIGIVTFQKTNAAWYGGYDDDLPVSQKLYEAYTHNKSDFYSKCSTMCGYILLRNNHEYSWNHDTKSFE
ncbi:hypothetical protein DNI29_10365 [Hymenobacter sediminis]|uniref:hypothetical protein n=1 Tax=Hymenobacter sediminis TaxID=2218621 RepID=UPI000DA671A5|nr:hypothetical protein [Hymenobacter sediminis]RPD47833.1 hypothetical protein DNI29_10365 [Hymenobacter sediminis]